MVIFLVILSLIRDALVWFWKCHTYVFTHKPNPFYAQKDLQPCFRKHMEEFASIKGIRESDYPRTPEVAEKSRKADQAWANKRLSKKFREKVWQDWVDSIPRPSKQLQSKVLDMTRQAYSMAKYKVELKALSEFTWELEYSLQKIAQTHLRNEGFYEELNKKEKNPHEFMAVCLGLLYLYIITTGVGYGLESGFFFDYN